MMTFAQARVLVYLLTAAVGAVLIVYGAVRADPAMIAAGAGYLGVGGLAAGNTHPPRDPDDAAPRRGDHAAE